MRAAKRLAAAAALIGFSANASAQTAVRAQACVSPAAAEALFLTVAPDALRRIGVICAASLPPSAILRDQPASLIGRYAAESEAAWPRARAALGSIVGDARQMLDSDLARPLLTTFAGELLAKEVKPGDCPVIDRILTLVEPLPPRNAAALVVTIVQLAQKPGRASPLTICSGPAPR